MKPKIALARCESYDLEEVYSAVKKTVDLLGGIGRYVKPGMKVLIKPNLLTVSGPEESVTTHPEVVRAVGRLVRGAGGYVSVGDSPGGFGKNMDEIFAASGMKRIAEEEGIELVKFTTADIVEGFPIAREVRNADLVISIPKLKTHCVTVMTGAIKNTFGMVTGVHKAECHSRAPEERDLAAILVKVHSVTKPRLTIIDGIVGMEGDGPSAGRPKAMNVVVAGEDPVAVDACISRMMGIDPNGVTLIRLAHEAGLGEIDVAKMDFVGDRPEGFVAEDFLLPRTMPLKMIPQPLLKLIFGIIKFRPRIDEDVCVRCGLCKTACPVKCIEIGKDACNIDYSRCIRCLCCHEICPHKAIEIRRNILARIIWG